MSGLIGIPNRQRYKNRHWRKEFPLYCEHDVIFDLYFYERAPSGLMTMTPVYECHRDSPQRYSHLHENNKVVWDRNDLGPASGNFWILYTSFDEAMTDIPKRCCFVKPAGEAGR